MRIGVLALQGAFAEHITKLKSLNVDCFEIRQCSDIQSRFNGLILPGGESTVMRKLLYDSGLYAPLKIMIANGLPVFGTCAGMILLAEKIEGEEQNCFGTMNITVKRNAYGRQLGSFRCVDKFINQNIEMPFIRAPYVLVADKNVQILSKHSNKIIAVQQGNQLATAFHPELTDDLTVYHYFLNMIEKSL